MSSINSIGSSAADLLAAIRQQLLAKTSTSTDAQKTSASGGGLEAIIGEIENSSGSASGSAGGSSQTTGSSGNRIGRWTRTSPEPPDGIASAPSTRRLAEYSPEPAYNW